MIVLTQQDDARFHAVRMLTDFDRTGERLSSVSARYLRGTERISHLEEITFIVQETMRWRGYLDSVISRFYRGKYTKAEHVLKNVLRLGAYELIFRNKVPSYAVVNEAVELTRRLASEKSAGLTNAILRKMSETDYPKPGIVSQSDGLAKISEVTSHPQWMIERWLNRYGFKDTIELCNWNNLVPSFTVWRNPAQVEASQWEEELESLGINWAKSTSIKNYYHVDSLSVLLQSEAYEKGWFAVQDTSSALIVMLVEESTKGQVLDVCCAPGGKTAALSSRLGTDVPVIASDVNEERLQKVRETLKRLKISNVTVEKKDAAKDNFQESNVILIDAPCTGTGVMSKRADLRWRRTEENLVEMQSLQLEILRHMANFVSSNGSIIYSTCSLEPEENWDVIDMLLEERNDFDVVPIERDEIIPFTDERGAVLTFPPRDGVDGVFGVILKKCS